MENFINFSAQDTLKIRPATSKGSSIDGSPESRTPEKTKTILTDRTSTARKRKELLERRSRGGGEEGDKIYPEFTHMMVREDAADIESRTSVATQVYVSPILAHNNNDYYYFSCACSLIYKMTLF